MSTITNIDPFPNLIQTLNPDFFRLPEYIQIVITAYQISKQIGRNMVKKINNLPLNRKLSNKFSIKEIFEVHWESFYKKYKYKIKRSCIVKNVKAMLGCGKFENGYQYYQCPNCTNFHIVGHTCKSRFCFSCGKKYSDARAIEISKKCVDVPHRHMVFTIPLILRDEFQRNHNLIDDLFKAVEDTFNYLISSKYSDKHQYKFGYSATLHTFGRAINFVPHLHILIAEAICDKDGKVKRYSHFHYEQLRKSFQHSLLKLVKQCLGDKSKRLIDKLYRNYKDGFYVYGPKINGINNNDTKEIVKYVVRYAGHPAMSESRIKDIDYDNKIVTYYYDPHEDDNQEDITKLKGRLYVSESFDDFISKLIVHIPDDGFQTIRYYGFYANKTKSKPVNFLTLFRKNELDHMKKMLNWRYRLLNSYGYDIILCECGHVMELDVDMCYAPNNKIRSFSYG